MRPRVLFIRRIVLLLGGLWFWPGLHAQAPPGAGPPLAVAQSAGLGLEEALLGIIAYSRWPKPPNPLRLCVAGGGPAAARLLQRGLQRPADLPPITVRGMPPDNAVAQDCDALYVGQVDDGTWQRLLPHLLGQPVLTVCERSPVCASGGMFCLDVDAAGHVQFEVNLDSVSRSQVRVHPQVLHLGRRLKGRTGS